MKFSVTIVDSQWHAFLFIFHNGRPVLLRHHSPHGNPIRLADFERQASSKFEGDLRRLGLSDIEYIDPMMPPLPERQKSIW